MTGIAARADELVSLARTLSFEPGAVTTLVNRLGAHGSTVPSTGLLVTFDGPSATGKDTQILLLAAALRRRGLTVRQSNVRAGGTGLEETLVTALRRNVGQAHPRRWHTDLLLKLAGWTSLTRLCGGMDAEVVISNRGGISALAYSAAAFDELSSQLPVIGIDAAGTRDEVHCDIGSAVTVALDSTARRPAAAPASCPCPRPPGTQTAAARPPFR